VVTAIGHTDDRLIADQVTDVATITPTAAGEYIVNSREEFLAARSYRWRSNSTPRTKPSSRSTNTSRNSPKQSTRQQPPEGLHRSTKGRNRCASVAVVGHHRAVAGNFRVENDSESDTEWTVHQQSSQKNVSMKTDLSKTKQGRRIPGTRRTLSRRVTSEGVRCRNRLLKTSMSSSLNGPLCLQIPSAIRRLPADAPDN